MRNVRSRRGSNSCDAGEGQGAGGGAASDAEKREAFFSALLPAVGSQAGCLEVEKEPRGIGRAVPLPADDRFMQFLACAKPLCTDLGRWSLVVPVLVLTSQSLPQVAQHEVNLPCTPCLPTPFTFSSVLSPGTLTIAGHKEKFGASYRSGYR